MAALTGIEVAVASEAPAFVEAAAPEGQLRKCLGNRLEHRQRKIPCAVEDEFERPFSDDLEMVGVPLGAPVMD
jgi:hypothetical protein